MFIEFVWKKYFFLFMMVWGIFIFDIFFFNNKNNKIKYDVMDLIFYEFVFYSEKWWVRVLVVNF